MQCTFFHLSLRFLFVETLLSGVSFLFASTTHDKNTTIVRSLVDRGGVIEDSQHCIDITKGQEERIRDMTIVVRKSFENCVGSYGWIKPGSSMSEYLSMSGQSLSRNVN